MCWRRAWKMKGITWQDAAIPGGAGPGGGQGPAQPGSWRVMRRMRRKSSAVSIGEWAELGLLLELDSVANSGNWNKAPVSPLCVTWSVIAAMWWRRRWASIASTPCSITANCSSASTSCRPLRGPNSRRRRASCVPAGIAPLVQSSRAVAGRHLVREPAAGDRRALNIIASCSCAKSPQAAGRSAPGAGLAAATHHEDLDALTRRRSSLGPKQSSDSHAARRPCS